jgi:hypothetical protein
VTQQHSTHHSALPRLGGGISNAESLASPVLHAFTSRNDQQHSPPLLHNTSVSMTSTPTATEFPPHNLPTAVTPPAAPAVGLSPMINKKVAVQLQARHSPAVESMRIGPSSHAQAVSSRLKPHTDHSSPTAKKQF